MPRSGSRPRFSHSNAHDARLGATGWILTCHGIFPPPSIRVRPNLRTDNEANEIHGRADHRHPGRTRGRREVRGLVPQAIRSHPNRRSVASPQTAPMTRASAMMPLRIEAPPPSSHPARTQNHGSRTLPERSLETKPCGRRNISVGRCGETGAAITAEAASKRRCTV